MILLGIIIQLVIFTLFAIAIALPLAGIVCWRSRRHRKRNTILAMLSPFVFIYSFYFTCLIGGFSCSSIFDTGCGMDGYYKADLPNGYQIESLADDFDREYFTGYIRKDGKRVIEWVTKIKVSGDSIFGERYLVNEAPGSEYYFTIDTKTDNIRQYESIRVAEETNPAIVTGLTHLEAFYYKSWPWVIPLTILAFAVSSGLVFLLWFIVSKMSAKWKHEKTSLAPLGVNGFAYSKNEALRIAEAYYHSNTAILGGDVYKLENGKIKLTYDSWYCDRSSAETISEYVNRSYQIARDYISRYHSNTNLLFGFVIEEKHDEI